ncbi:MAG: SAM-dependent methyltransferase [Verrucomicrobiota bacterium]
MPSPCASSPIAQGEWHERCVDISGEGFSWTDLPIRDAELRLAIGRAHLPGLEGYTTEINLRAWHWIGDVGRALHRGYVVTIDYGFPGHEYYATHRTAGTLTGYSSHRRVDDILASPARTTSPRTSISPRWCVAAATARLRALGFVDQQRFLTGIAHDELGSAAGPRAGVAENTRAFQTLTHPQHLGAAFQVLVQGKDAPAPSTACASRGRPAPTGLR